MKKTKKKIYKKKTKCWLEKNNDILNDLGILQLNEDESKKEEDRKNEKKRKS